MIGAGKYDVHCQGVLVITQAKAVLLQVIGGDQGSGFSVAATDPQFILHIPLLLRRMADQIESMQRQTGIEVYVKEAAPRDGPE